MKISYKELAETARQNGGRAPHIRMNYFSRYDLITALRKSSSYVEACIRLGLLKDESGNSGKTFKHLIRISKYHAIDIDKYIQRKYPKRDYSPNITDEIMAREVLVLNGERQPHTRQVKMWLYSFELKERVCEECGTGELWNRKSITLELHHRNGNRKDNRLENLQILCPNCHSQTDTYRSKNIK